MEVTESVVVLPSAVQPAVVYVVVENIGLHIVVVVVFVIVVVVRMVVRDVDLDKGWRLHVQGYHVICCSAGRGGVIAVSSGFCCRLVFIVIAFDGRGCCRCVGHGGAGGVDGRVEGGEYADLRIVDGNLSRRGVCHLDGESVERRRLVSILLLLLVLLLLLLLRLGVLLALFTLRVLVIFHGFEHLL